MRTRLAAVAAALMLANTANIVAADRARADVPEVVLSQQFGAIFLPLMAMENLKLVEKHAQEQGLKDLKVSWQKMAGPAVMVDGIISGSLHFSAQGVPSAALMWDKTNGGVKSVAAITNTEIYLNTRSPNIKTLKDYTDKDRIALPSVKVSTQAIFLQIAAEQEWGPGQHARLDHLTVALAHPDALAAVLNPNGEITSHFATSPFHEAEMKAGFHTVTSAYKIMGGPTSNLVFVTTEKFRAENPKTYAAVVAALDEAMNWINGDKRRAAKLYIEMTREKKLTEDDIVAIISADGFDFTTTPKMVGKFVEHMHKVGSLKQKPATWKDMFFPEAHKLPGH